jgi:hypothetical protein
MAAGYQDQIKAKVGVLAEQGKNIGGNVGGKVKR